MIEKVFYKIMDSLGPYKKKPHIAVAVSGGSDSLCLAILAKKWIDKKKGNLTALIVDHQLRKNSSKECVQTKKTLEEKNILSHCFKWNLNNKPKNGIQEKAREFRYNVFEDWCFKNKITNLLIAHHFEDQKETLLMRLNDNSNVYGLACMPKIFFKKEMRILRPLLNFKKKNITQYLKKENIQWIEDPSNNSTKYSRNIYRKEVLPKLFKKGLTDNKLKRILESAQKERKKIEAKCSSWINKNVVFNSLGYGSVNLKKLKLINKEDFVFIFSKILCIISGSNYVTKSKYINNFYEKIKCNLTIHDINLGGCHIIFFKEKIYICREIFKKNRKQNINFQFNKIIWDNRFEIKHKNDHKFFLRKKLGKSVFIKQLEKNGWNEILLKNKKIRNKINLPNKIILTLPALKNKKNDVLYVPHLKYYSNMKTKKQFSKINFFFEPKILFSSIY